MGAPKKGKVVRVSELADEYFKGRKEKTIREKIDATINELHDLSVIATSKEKPDYFVLPESRIVCSSEEEARGLAIVGAVKKGKMKDFEQPIPVKKV